MSKKNSEAFPAEDHTDDSDDEIQDWRSFLIVTNSSTSKKESLIIPKRGEKDYAPDGTRIQRDILAESRDAMYTALSGIRGHSSKQQLEAVFYPELKKAVVNSPKGPFFKTMGLADSNSKLWLNIEEVVYLSERGSLLVCLENGLPVSLDALYSLAFEDEEELDRYHVYAHLKRHGYLVLRNEEEKYGTEDSKQLLVTSLERTLCYQLSFNSIHQMLNQVFNFKISKLVIAAKDFMVVLLRQIGIMAHPPFHEKHFEKTSYFNYLPIFKSLRIIRSYKQNGSSSIPIIENTPYKISFNVWKPVPSFKKSAPPKPDWQVVVINTNSTPFPTLLEIHNLFNQSISTVERFKPRSKMNAKPKHSVRDTGKKGNNNSSNTVEIQRRNEEFKKRDHRLKNGYKHILIALTNHGVINFVKLSEADFSQEEIWTDPINNSKY